MWIKAQAKILWSVHKNIAYASSRWSDDRAGPRGVVYGGGGGGGLALEAECLKRAAQAVRGGRVWEGGRTPCSLEGVRGCSTGFFFKIYVSENAFQAIFNPIFSYSITSILSKVRHSNPRGGGYSDSFICIRRLGLFFGGLKFRKFWGFSEKWMFFRVWRFCGCIFGGSSQIMAIVRGHFYAL